MTISNEDILKYFMTDEYPHDAGTLAAKEKIELLQRQLNESGARVGRLENGLIGCAKTLREYNEADSQVYLSLTKETKSQSLQHIQVEALENVLVKVEQIIDEASIGISSCEATETVGEIIREIKSLREQQTGSDGDE